MKDFFSKCDQIRNLVTFTEEILNGKLQFLCSLLGGLSHGTGIGIATKNLVSEFHHLVLKYISNWCIKLNFFSTSYFFVNDI